MTTALEIAMARAESLHAIPKNCLDYTEVEMSNEPPVFDNGVEVKIKCRMEKSTVNCAKGMIKTPLAMNRLNGACDQTKCPRWQTRMMCNCKPVCKWCGHGEHCAIHGPVNNGDPGSKPYGHEYVAESRPR